MKAEATKQTPCPSKKAELPPQPTTSTSADEEATRSSMNGLVLRRMQRMASDRWGTSKALPADTSDLGRSTPARCASNSRLEVLRQSGDDSTNRRKKLCKTKSATQVINRTAGKAQKQTDEAPRRIPRKSLSSSAARTSVVEGTEPQRGIRRAASSSSKRSKRSGAPKQPQWALSPIPRKKNTVAPIAA